MSWWPFVSFEKHIENTVNKSINDYFKSEGFKRQVLKATLKQIRDYPNDKPVSFIGFINKIAVALYDASRETMSYDEAKRQASGIYQDFKNDTKASFGDPGFDWTGAAAVELANEYSIQYWS